MNPSIVSFLAVCTLAAGAASQSVTNLLTGSALSTRTGQDIANAGDVDGDGVDDIIIGIEEDSTGPRSHQFAGRATLLSGATRAVIYSWTGEFIGDRLGCAVDGAGDVNGDGIPDLVVGARGVDKLVGPPYYGDAGSVYVFSGADGSVLFKVNCWDFVAPSFVVDDARFGYAVAGAGDVNADGYADIIVGSYVGTRQPSLGGEGAAVVISGRTSAAAGAPNAPPVVLWSFHGGAPQHYLGFSVDGAGDVNGDSYDDLVVGAIDAGNNNGNGSFAGEVLIFDGQTGFELDSLTGTTVGEFFGGSVAGVGDVDRDGKDDVAVGIVFAAGRGEAHVYSGAGFGLMTRPQNFLLHQLPGGAVNDLQGFDVNGGGDINGDGHPDIVVGSILASGGIPVSGVVRVYSGVPDPNNAPANTMLHQFDGPQTGGGYGFSVALGGDHDGDGFAEALVGAPYHDVGPVVDAGIAELLDLDQVGTPPRVRQVGPGCSAPRGAATVLPTLQLRGRAALGETFGMRLRGCPLNQMWILNIGAGVDVDLTPYGMPGCRLYSTGDGFVFQPNPPVTDPVHGTGSFFPGIPIPNDMTLIGVPLYFQANMIAPGANAAGVVVSNGLELTFGN